LPAKLDVIASLEAMMAQPDFWNNSDKAQQIVQQLKSMKVVIEPLKKALQACDDLSELAEMLDDDPSAEAEVLTELSQLELAVEQLELQSLLNGPLDNCGAILSVHAREGGLDANDWAEMLIGMYASWAQKHGYNAELVDRCDNEGAGITQATIIVRGPFAYGFLRGEEGIHRLVRISPYNAEGKRQTSFAAVDVSPEVEDSVEVEIVVQCQNDRSQHKNRAQAWKMLRARLARIEEEKREAEIAAKHQNKSVTGFGSQIRNYFLHPDQRVKDSRTGFQMGSFHAVLGGDIQGFLESFLKHRMVSSTEE
jgi:peptide chain release factor 2